MSVTALPSLDELAAQPERVGGLSFEVAADLYGRVAVLSRLLGAHCERSLTETSPQHRTDRRIDANWLDVVQVAGRLNLPVSRVRELSRHQGGPPFKRIGKYLRIAPADLHTWLEQLPAKGLDSLLCRRHADTLSKRTGRR